MPLNDYHDYTVIKRCKEKTPFYPYKINFVLSQLKLTDEEKGQTIQQLEKQLNKANSKTVTAQNIWTWIDSSLPEKARQKFEAYRQADTESYRSIVQTQSIFQ